MPIEIKEVIIKTSVEKEPELNGNETLSHENLNLLKQEILKNCEQMINKLFKEQQER